MSYDDREALAHGRTYRASIEEAEAKLRDGMADERNVRDWLPRGTQLRLLPFKPLKPNSYYPYNAVLFHIDGTYRNVDGKLQGHWLVRLEGQTGRLQNPYVGRLPRKEKEERDMLVKPHRIYDLAYLHGLRYRMIEHIRHLQANHKQITQDVKELLQEAPDEKLYVLHKDGSGETSWAELSLYSYMRGGPSAEEKHVSWAWARSGKDLHELEALAEEGARIASANRDPRGDLTRFLKSDMLIRRWHYLAGTLRKMKLAAALRLLPCREDDIWVAKLAMPDGLTEAWMMKPDDRDVAHTQLFSWSLAWTENPHNPVPIIEVR
jgi:hypothetical protein